MSIINSSGGGSSGGGGLTIDDVYPVGSIYMSVNDTSPATLFGGTWEQLKDRFLLGAGDTYSNGTIGGEATHKLITSEMPSHNHTFTPSGSVTYSSGSASILTAPGSSSYGYVAQAGTNATLSTNSSNKMQEIKGSSASKENSREITLSFSGSGTFSGTSSSTGSKGSDGAHNNMPPYLVIYMWKRTA